jgi:N-acetylneuraminic acid mutarotase
MVLIGKISHHTSVVYGDKMYLFGGSTSTQENETFYSLDLKNWKWEVINSRGEDPVTRDEHTANLYENSMIVFGGFTNGSRVNDLHRYYFHENKWEKIVPLSKQLPSPRSGHSTIIKDDSMIVFGGKDDENNKLNDIWELHLSTLKWE